MLANTANPTDLAVEIAALASLEEIVRGEHDTWLDEPIDRIVRGLVPADELETVRARGVERGVELADELYSGA